ncbi:MAG: flagellar biosynthesis anti-sigma factor FlgM [Phycisphaerales bacterium JB039]
MSDVGPISPLSAGPRTRAENDRPSRPEVDTARRPGRAADRLELSEKARLLASMRAPQPVRLDLVERIRAEIADDSYETPEKVIAAADALLADFELRE